MEFLTTNLYETTTAIVVNSNTITAENILSPNIRRQYVSDGFADDATTTTIRIQFDSTQTVDRICIRGFNAKKFNVYYNGATANAFALTGPTTTSQWLTNSATSLYLQATPVACTSVSFDLYSTIVANSEKAVGQIILAQNEFTFPRIPAAGSYTPLFKAKELLHDLSDGGQRRHLVTNKWDVKIKFTHIDQDFRDDLKTIYDEAEPKIFVPFGTASGWDEIIFEANWVGSFEFFKYSDNAVAAGYSGQIQLKET